jgi:hypothetical protein
MNQVWNPNDNDKKILKYLYDFIEGSRASLIKKYTGLKTSTLYKRLNILKDQGWVIDEFPIWKIVNGEVKIVESLLQSKEYFELHNPGYVVRLSEVPVWWNPKGSQMKAKLMMIKDYLVEPVKNFGKNNSNPYIQIKNSNYVIQMYPEAITVIHRKRYHSQDPYDLTMQFMNDFYNLWAWFEERMKFKFFNDGVPQMTLRGHDYNRVNDWMSKYVLKREKKRVLIEIGDGRKVWYDLSDPKGRETNTPELQKILERDIQDKILKKPKLNSELQKEIEENKTESLTQINEAFSLIKKSSKLMLDSEMRWKQLENRLRGQEVLIYQLVEEIRKWKR